jgi:hypothetical protein
MRGSRYGALLPLVSDHHLIADGRQGSPVDALQRQRGPELIGTCCNGTILHIDDAYGASRLS